VHGVASYFLERARFARRLALVTLGVSVVFYSLLGLGLVRPVRRTLARATARFGFEGPTEYVRHITLRQLQGTTEPSATWGP